MLRSTRISSCKIKNQQLHWNGTCVYEAGSEISTLEFLNQLYKHLEINYPKFFKMDLLCKLGILASELLLKDLSETERISTAIYLCNRASSLETDRKHYANIQSESGYFPSPSVFVYTLPNIVIGEICIRHKIMGEGIFFLSECPNFEDLHRIADLAIRGGIAKQVLLGRVESDKDIAEVELELHKAF